MANSTMAKGNPKAKGEGAFAKISKFVRDSYIETRFKSAWPTRTELWQFTMVVIFAILVVAIWIGGLDLFMKYLTGLLEQ